MIWTFRIKQPAALVEAYAEQDRLSKDLAYWQTRALTVGRLSQELRRERDEANAALSEADKHIAGLESRLDALTPARGDDGRFVGKAVSHG